MKRLFQIDRTVWRHRDLRLVAPARALSLLGDDVALVALTLRVHDQGGGPWGIAALLGTAALATAAATPLVGRVVDRVDSRVLTTVAALWQAACCALLALGLPWWLLLPAVAALQLGQALASPAWTALVPGMVGEAETGRALAMLQATSTGAALAGPAIGGLLVAGFGPAWPLLLDGATFLLLAGVALAVRARRGGAAGAPEPGDGPRSGLGVLRADPLLAQLVLGLLVLVAVGEVSNVVEVFLVRDTLAAGSAAYGFLGAAYAAGMFAGSLLAGRARDTEARRRAVVAACAGVGLGVVAGGLSPGVAVFAVAWLLTGTANGVLNACLPALLLGRTPEHLRGRVIATVMGATRAAAVLALAAGGALGGLASPRAVFVGSGLLVTLVAVGLARRTRPRADSAGLSSAAGRRIVPMYRTDTSV